MSIQKYLNKTIIVESFVKNSNIFNQMKIEKHMHDVEYGIESHIEYFAFIIDEK